MRELWTKPVLETCTARKTFAKGHTRDETGEIKSTALSVGLSYKDERTMREGNGT